MDLAFMNILVTGGCGFIGSNVAYKYLKEGHSVTILDNLSRSNVVKNLNWLKSNFGDRLRFIQGDVRDLQTVKDSVNGVDRVFHFAAQVAVTSSITDPKLDFEVNALGTFNVLESIRQSKDNPTFLLTSTNKVYGNNVNDISINESDYRYSFGDEELAKGVPEHFPTDANEHTPYGNSKYMADLMARDYYAVYGIPAVTFRMSCIYGTRQFGNEDQGWVAHFIIQTLLKKPLTIFGTGKQVRDVLFVEDLLRAFDLSLKHIDRTKGRAYNIGGGPDNTLSLLELLAMIEKLTGSNPKVSFADWRPFDQKVYVSNIKKAYDDFQWKPEINPREGVARLVQWVQSNLNIF
jgi:CDP-paratose 2-epimerase